MILQAVGLGYVLIPWKIPPHGRNIALLWFFLVFGSGAWCGCSDLELGGCSHRMRWRPCVLESGNPTEMSLDSSLQLVGCLGGNWPCISVGREHVGNWIPLKCVRFLLLDLIQSHCDTDSCVTCHTDFSAPQKHPTKKAVCWVNHDFT